MKVLELFRSGLDTNDIARRLTDEYGREIPESLVYNAIHRERSAEKGLEVRFERHRRSAA